MAQRTFDEPIFVAGHRGMVGSAIVRALERAGATNLILRSSSELDLRDQHQVREFMMTARPKQVYLAAAKVGAFTPTTPTVPNSCMTT